MADNNAPMRVELFGEFAIIADGRRVAESTKKSSKVWKLIKYLAAHRKRPVPQDELLDIFCRDESKGNPGSILRTMVYRARGMLAENGLEQADEIITAKSGCYMWNSGIDCVSDTDEFEDFIKQASDPGIDEDEKLTLLMQAITLYKGDFLQGMTGDMWVIPLTRWYRDSFVRVVHETLDLLMKKERYMDAEKLSTRALEIDPFDEKFIESYLKTLLALKKNREAFNEYKKMESMFYDELGVEFSDELHALYGEIQQSGINEHAPLQDVLKDWIDDIVDVPHVYYCDAGDFKILCQIEALSASRTGHTAFVVRFDTKHEPNTKAVAKGKGIMNELERAIKACLRKSDIYTRYSPSQYLLLLRRLTYEDCKMLVSRILNKLSSKNLPDIINTSIMHISPTSEILHPEETAEGANAQ